MFNIRKFIAGLGIVPKTTLVSDSKGELEVLNSDGSLNYHNGATRAEVTTASNTTSFTNKTFDADGTGNSIINIENADIKAAAAIDATKIANGSVTNTEFQYLDGVTSAIQTQINGKTSSTLTDTHILVGNGSNLATDVAVSGDVTVTNTGNFQIATGVIVNADVNASANIDASKLGTGTVDNTEFGYLNGVTSAIQTQLSGKVTGPGSSTDNAVVRFDGAGGSIVQNSPIIISDTGNITGVADLTSSGTITSTGVISAQGAVLKSVSSNATVTGANATMSSPTTPFVRLTNASLTSIDMISVPTDGQVITVENATGNSITINNNTGGTAANRILTGTKANLTLADEASIVLQYDPTETRWMVIGGSGAGGSSSLDTIFQLTGTDVPLWSTGDNATFLGGGTISGTFAADTSTPLHGASSYKYTQAAGSLNDYFVSAAQTVDLRFRGVNVNLFFPYTYDGATNDIEVILYDATNSAIIPNSAFIQVTSGVTTFRTNVTIPLTCASIRVGFMTRVLNSGKIFAFDDVQLASNYQFISDVANISSWQSYIPTLTGFGTATSIEFEYRQVGQNYEIRGKFVSGTPSGVEARASLPNSATSANTSLIPSIHAVGTLFNSSAVSGSNKQASVLIEPSVTYLTFGRVIEGTTNSALTKANGSQIVATAGDIQSLFASVPINGLQATNQNLLLAPDTFNSDSNALTYAGSATYTLSTLANAPVGTFITYTYAINTNTATQTTTAPTQTTTSMNTNGIQLFTRAYNTASTAGNPARIAIQVGKGMKGTNLQAFGSTSKADPASIDLVVVSTTVQIGLKFKEYNETTGILVLDAGRTELSSNTSNTLTSLTTDLSSAYMVINASKNPALTGLNLGTIAARGVNTAGTSVSNASIGTIIYDSTKTYDTHNALVAATGIYTVPESGYYQVNGALFFQTGIYVVGDLIQLLFYKNGTLISQGINTAATTTTSRLGVSISDTIFATKGDTIEMRAQNGRTAGATLLDTGSYSNHFAIAKVSQG